MQILWKREKAFVKEIIAELDEPKPAYNTISTIVRILQEKGFVDYTAFGKSHQYFPTIDQKEYTDHQISKITDNYFQGSFSNLVSFFVKKKDIDVSEVEELLKKLKEVRDE